MNQPLTPKIVKILLSLMTGLTIWLAFMPQLAPWFGLSNIGIKNFFYWQWISYSLFEPSNDGVTFGLILSLGFSLYLLWMFGNALVARLSSQKFFALFIGSAFVGGLTAWGLLTESHTSQIFINTTPPLYACLFAWTMLNAETQVLLFFAIPFNAARALYVFLGISLLIDLSHSNWPAAVALVSAAIYAYFFILFSEKILSPFSFLHPLERILLGWRRSSQKPPASYQSSKIYDIRSGKPVLDDEQFMDAMLTRISLYGEDSLAPEDRKRMDQISRIKRGR